MLSLQLTAFTLLLTGAQAHGLGALRARDYAPYPVESPVDPVPYPTSPCTTTVTKPGPYPTATYPVTSTYCPVCSYETGTNDEYKTVYTTVYDHIGPTGPEPKTYTVTETCKGAPKAPEKTHVPEGFTTTVTECTVCADTPVTTTLTVPVGTPSGGAPPVVTPPAGDNTPPTTPPAGDNSPPVAPPAGDNSSPPAGDNNIPPVPTSPAGNPNIAVSNEATSHTFAKSAVFGLAVAAAFAVL